VPFCSATKSSVFPRVLFITAVSSSLGGAVEGGGSPASPSSSPKPVRSVGLGAGTAYDAGFPALINFKASTIIALSAFSFFARSRFVISAEVNPAALASPLVFFLFHTLLGIASGMPIGSWARASLRAKTCNLTLHPTLDSKTSPVTGNSKKPGGNAAIARSYVPR
jgi:hypothetical protein